MTLTKTEELSQIVTAEPLASATQHSHQASPTALRRRRVRKAPTVEAGPHC